MHPHNLYSDIPDSLPDELFDTLLNASGFRIERIVSHGHCSDEDFWYDQSEDEWIVLLKGAARLMMLNEHDHAIPYELQPGDYLHIPAHTRHRVDWTDPDRHTVWLAVHG